MSTSSSGMAWSAAARRSGHVWPSQAPQQQQGQRQGGRGTWSCSQQAAREPHLMVRWPGQAASSSGCTRPARLPLMTAEGTWAGRQPHPWPEAASLPPGRRRSTRAESSSSRRRRRPQMGLRVRTPSRLMHRHPCRQRSSPSGRQSRSLGWAPLHHWLLCRSSRRRSSTSAGHQGAPRLMQAAATGNRRAGHPPTSTIIISSSSSSSSSNVSGRAVLVPRRRKGQHRHRQ